MKTSSLCIAGFLLLLIAAFVSFGLALQYAEAAHTGFGWTVIPPLVLTITSMICLNAAEFFASRGD